MRHVTGTGAGDTGRRRPAPLFVQLLPVGPGGVADHAAELQRRWQRAGHAVLSLPLDRATVQQQALGERLAAEAGRPVAVLLHFSGYGYDDRGLCGWLVQALRDARRQLGDRLRVVTLFHELFAGGPPWRSAFWLGPWQARLARALLGLSDSVVTNTALHRRWLQGQASRPAQDVAFALPVLPVFSNVGEPVRHVPLTAREHQIVLFGSTSTRRRAVVGLSARLDDLRALGVRRIVEAGHGDSVVPPGLGMAHSHRGSLGAETLSELLLHSRWALIDYPSVHLAKSSVLAAYAAHGCAVINTAAPGPDADGLQAGRHYLGWGREPGLPMADTAWAAMAERLQAWYAEHPAAVQAGLLAACLAGRPVDDVEGDDGR